MQSSVNILISCGRDNTLPIFTKPQGDKPTPFESIMQMSWLSALSSFA